MTRRKRQLIILRNVMLFMSGLCLFVTAVAFGMVHYNKWVVRLSLEGDKEAVLEVGDSWTEPGAAADYHGSLLSFLSGDLTVQKSGEVNTGKVGTYTVCYKAVYNGVSQTAERTVVVRDTQPPEIKLTSDPEHYTLPGHEYEEEGFVATDNYDGDITSSVVREERHGIVYYSVTDSSGNKATAERMIVYDDQEAPVITLEGEETVRIKQGTPFVDSFTALDNGDGDITSLVQVEGGLDINKPGTYHLEYTVADTHGNEAYAERTVIVDPDEEKAEKKDPEQEKVEMEKTEAEPKSEEEPPAEPVNEDNGKVIYLTFDDGPGPYTDRLLDILDQYGVKATFFVTNEYPSYQYCIAKEAERGHRVAIHTYSHDYASIYASDEAFWEDYEKMQAVIEQQTGSRASLMRFPGGSSNMVSAKYNEGIMSRLTQQAGERGYTYVDWNVSSGDAGETKDSEQIAANIIAGIQKYDVSVVLCHDIHEYTVDAMEEVLKYATENGYTFAPLSESSFTAHHSVHN